MMEPKIRFKGFEGEWKAPLFSEMVERISASGQAGMLPGVEFEDIASGEGCFNKNIYQKECHKYGKLFYEGDILFGKLRPYLKNIILADFNGVAIGDFWVLRSKGLDEKYLYTLVNSESFLKVANISSGSKMPRADWNLVSTTKFVVPSAKDEQKVIGKYFTSLDSQISASTSRLASLKQMKAASLQAMFPQEGETVPKIRFKGFEGEWKKVKLGDIAKFSKGQGYSKSDLKETGHPIILYGRMYTKYQFAIDEVDTFANLKDASILSEGNEIIMPASGETPEDIACASAVLAKDIILGGDLNIMHFDLTKFSTPFIALGITYCKTHHDLSKCAQGKSVVHLHNGAISRATISLSSLAEQQAIASYFTSLDRQISLQSQRLEKLKQIKSACLDKMFV